MENRLDRNPLNPDVCQDKPTLRNMRYPLERVLDLLSSGRTQEEILADCPALEEADIHVCLAYASRLVHVKSVHKMGA